MKKLLAFILFLVVGVANAQTHTFKFILSSGPGSGSDVAIDAFGQCFKSNNINIQKEFRPGGDGIIAVRAMQASQNTETVTHILVGNFGLNMLSKFPDVNLLEDINPITYLTHTSLVFISKHGTTFEDLINLSKKRPLNVGTSFIGGTWLAQNLFDNLKVSYQIVPYKNNVNSTVDVINGNLDIAVDTFLATRQLHETEKVQIVLSSLDRKEAKQFNIPSIERYDPKMADVPFGPILSVSPNTTKQNKERLEQVVIACNKDIDTSKKIEKLGGSPVIITTEQLRNLVKRVSTSK